MGESIIQNRDSGRQKIAFDVAHLCLAELSAFESGFMEYFFRPFGSSTVEQHLAKERTFDKSIFTFSVADLILFSLYNSFKQFLMIGPMCSPNLFCVRYLDLFDSYMLSSQIYFTHFSLDTGHSIKVRNWPFSSLHRGQSGFSTHSL